MRCQAVLVESGAVANNIAYGAAAVYAENAMKLVADVNLLND